LDGTLYQLTVFSILAWISKSQTVEIFVGGYSSPEMLNFLKEIEIGKNLRVSAGDFSLGTATDLYEFFRLALSRNPSEFQSNCFNLLKYSYECPNLECIYSWNLQNINYMLIKLLKSLKKIKMPLITQIAAYDNNLHAISLKALIQIHEKFIITIQSNEEKFLSTPLILNDNGFKHEMNRNAYLYEESLTKLLLELDVIEIYRSDELLHSYDELKDLRKAIVNNIERRLSQIDQVKKNVVVLSNMFSNPLDEIEQCTINQFDQWKLDDYEEANSSLTISNFNSSLKVQSDTRFAIYLVTGSPVLNGHMISVQVQLSEIGDINNLENWLYGTVEIQVGSDRCIACGIQWITSESKVIILLCLPGQVPTIEQTKFFMNMEIGVNVKILFHQYSSFYEPETITLFSQIHLNTPSIYQRYCIELFHVAYSIGNDIHFRDWKLNTLVLSQIKIMKALQISDVPTIPDFLETITQSCVYSKIVHIRSLLVNMIREQEVHSFNIMPSNNHRYGRNEMKPSSLYEEGLLDLQRQLDSIEILGDNFLRNFKKDVAFQIECRLSCFEKIRDCIDEIVDNYRSG
jgi:hypothetical protein